MSKIRNLAEITPNIPFTEFNFYDLYRSTFEKSELGRIKKLLPEVIFHAGRQGRTDVPEDVHRSEQPEVDGGGIPDTDGQ